MQKRSFFEWFGRPLFSNLDAPCFIYDVELIRQKMEGIKAAFLNIPHKQYYPVKTNYNRDIIHFCLNNGLGLDACSMGDLDIAEKLKVPPQDISFTGVALTEEEMRCLNRRHIIPNLGSLAEFNRWGRLYPNSRTGVRVSAGGPEHFHHEQYSLKTGVLPTEWGLLKETAQRYNLQIIKIHRHESKNELSSKQLLSSFAFSFDRLPEWLWKHVTAVNFGGGWGLPYQRDGELNTPELAKGMADITKKIAAKTASRTLTIEFEPGEFLIGESGFLLTRVMEARIIDVKSPPREIQVIILNSPFPITSGFRKPELLSPVELDPAIRNDDGKRFPTIVYGRSNTIMDTINKNIMLPAARVGEWALVQSVGAYAPILLSYFNEQDIPAEYIHNNGSMSISRKCLKFSDFYNRAYTLNEGADDERI